MKPLPNNLLKCIDPAERRRMGKTARTWDEIEVANDKKMEGQLHKEIAALLNQREIWFGHSQFGKKSTFTPGAPDFLFFYNGRGWGMEAKIGKAEPSPEQIECHCQMRRNGWLVFVVRSVQQAKGFLDGK